MRLGIVSSLFNDDIASRLLSRAEAEAAKLGLMGAVIRGETHHFEVVANESARGLMDVALEYGLPVGNGILTTDDEQQALARIDKGAEAVRVAVEMAKLRERLA
jgi:6,7-dimethyl-8-ribityllumazine synthase